MEDERHQQSEVRDLRPLRNCRHQYLLPINVVGQGAYGVVVAAKDKEAANQEKNLVAIKKIDKAFEHKIFTKRTLRELRLLKLLKHENVQ